MKSKIENDKLVVPKNGNAPMLFLESLIEENSFGNGLVVKVDEDLDNYEGPVFKIKIWHASDASMERVRISEFNCMRYINDNL